MTYKISPLSRPPRKRPSFGRTFGQAMAGGLGNMLVNLPAGILSNLAGSAIKTGFQPGQKAWRGISPESEITNLESKRALDALTQETGLDLTRAKTQTEQARPNLMGSQAGYYDVLGAKGKQDVAHGELMFPGELQRSNVQTEHDETMLGVLQRGAKSPVVEKGYYQQPGTAAWSPELPKKAVRTGAGGPRALNKLLDGATKDIRGIPGGSTVPTMGTDGVTTYHIFRAGDKATESSVRYASASRKIRQAMAIDPEGTRAWLNDTAKAAGIPPETAAKMAPIDVLIASRRAVPTGTARPTDAPAPGRQGPTLRGERKPLAPVRTEMTPSDRIGIFKEYRRDASNATKQARRMREESGRLELITKPELQPYKDGLMKLNEQQALIYDALAAEAEAEAAKYKPAP